MSAILPADWPAPPGVVAFTTLRFGAGSSVAPFDSFNLGLRNGDEVEVAQRNRAELVERFGLPSLPCWLKQVHGIEVRRFSAPAPAKAEAEAERVASAQTDYPSDHATPPQPSPAFAGEGAEPEADASVTSDAGVVLAILTADCLPVAFAAKDGGEVGVAHAGWPGLSKGVLEATVATMRTPPERLLAWIGPGAGPQRYEVGVDVYEAFVGRDARAASAFAPTRPGHWLADLPALARMRLADAGLLPADIHGGDLCTISDPARFFSHRRDQRTGRMATLVWMRP